MKRSGVLIWVFLLLPSGILAKTTKTQEKFFALLDPATNVQVLELAPDKYNPNIKRSVKCYEYKNFVIKVVDYGEKGAAQLSVLPKKSEQEISCQEKNLNDEVVIGDWSGYFYGVKGDYTFFSSDDGSLGGGVAFMVYNAREHKIVFADEAANNKNGIMMTKVSADANGLKLSYRRNYFADCSVITDGECAAQIANAIGIANTLKKKCKTPYKKLKKSERSTPTYISYDVEVFLPKEVVFNIKDATTVVMQQKSTPFLKKKSDAIECIPSM